MGGGAEDVLRGDGGENPIDGDSAATTSTAVTGPMIFGQKAGRTSCAPAEWAPTRIDAALDAIS